eukprot:366063-Chlamydomonas_euryale.AAC.14
MSGTAAACAPPMTMQHSPEELEHGQACSGECRQPGGASIMDAHVVKRRGIHAGNITSWKMKHGVHNRPSTHPGTGWPQAFVSPSGANALTRCIGN